MTMFFDRKKLQSAIRLASRVAQTRSPKPIYSCVLIEVRDGTATITAANGETWLKTVVDNVTGDNGVFVVPCDKLSQILNTASSDSLAVEIDGSKVNIKSASAKFSVLTQNAQDFPPMLPVDMSGSFTVPGTAIVAALSRAKPAAESESSRYALGGVFFDVGENVVNAVATNGRALFTQQLPAETRQECNAILPLAAVDLVAAIVSESEPCEIAIAENNFVVRSGTTVVLTRPLEGRFPAWRNVLPKGNAANVDIQVGALLDAAQQSLVMIDQHSDRTGTDVEFAPGSINLRSVSVESGQSDVSVVCSGDASGKTSLNMQLVVDAIAKLPKTSMATVEYRNAESAVVIRSEDGFTAVVMPLARTE